MTESVTKLELVPKSIILDNDTKTLVSRAYLPKSSRGSVLATAVKKIRPNTELNILPKLTKEIFKKDSLIILIIGEF